jgi:hypothetical protein
MKCKTCGTTLTNDNWTVSNRAHRYRQCRDCKRQYDRERYPKNKSAMMARSQIWREGHPDAVHVIQRRYADKIKRLVIAHYSNGKMICSGLNGESCKFGCDDLRCLTIDHINDNGAKHRKSIRVTGSAFYKWLIRRNFPSDYQVLCFNCQWVKEFERRRFGNSH